MNVRPVHYGCWAACEIPVRTLLDHLKEGSPLVFGKSANDRNSGACQDFGGASKSDFPFIIKIGIVAKPLPEAGCEPKCSGNCAIFGS